MEEDITLSSQQLNASLLNPAQLAYIGDAVYEIYIRHYLLTLGITKSSKLQQKAETFVKAQMQNEALRIISPMLSEEEQKVVLRGRNNKHKNKPKNASVEEYNNATGLEALMGYLYLNKRKERMDKIISVIISHFNKE
jgi:ribonuclease-3 family protein